MAKRKAKAGSEDQLRSYALGFPGVREDFPWGESAFKVRNKTFLFLHSQESGFSMTVKLPESGRMALLQPFAQPTGYGLGKSGWVTARFDRDEAPPFDRLREWIEESYRTIAPQNLIAELDDPGSQPTESKKPPKKTSKKRRSPKARNREPR